MNVFLSFDYELYFGKNTGTQKRCMTEPTNKIMKLLDKYEINATFFVDCGYLLKLQIEKEKHPQLISDYESLYRQLKQLDEKGHDLQLHIHPHWEDCYFDGKKWIMDTSRYRLHDFSDQEIENIVYRYKKVLTDIVGNKVFAYRGGGWCIQPFERLSKALKKHNIWLDSTVFEGGQNNSSTHYFDFREVPQLNSWSFETNPCEERKGGYFREIPISSHKLSAFFFWKLAFYQKFGGKEHENFGDGTAAGGSRWDKLRMLTRKTRSVVSVDGYKSSYLEQSYISNRNENFVVIGHPKSMTPYSLKKLERFIVKSTNKKFTTYRKEFCHEI